MFEVFCIVVIVVEICDFDLEIFSLSDVGFYYFFGEFIGCLVEN